MSSSTGHPRAEDSPACEACRQGVRGSVHQAASLSGGLWSFSGLRLSWSVPGTITPVRSVCGTVSDMGVRKRCPARRDPASLGLASTPASWARWLTSGPLARHPLRHAGDARGLHAHVPRGVGFASALLSSCVRSPRSYKHSDDCYSHSTEGTSTSQYFHL